MILALDFLIFYIFSGILEVVTEEEPLSTELEIPVPVQAVSGSRLSLPCDITSPIINDEVYLVLWYKDDVATPIYSLDARRGQLSQARHATNEALSGRAFFSTVPQPAVLEIDKITLADEGLYKCRVDFQKARTQHFALVVSVTIPPGVPLIKDHNGKVLSGVIGPFNEGESLRLICQAEGGKPSPSLIWWKNRRILDDSYDSVDKITRNELLIEKLQRSDLMTTLICQTTNNVILPPLEVSVTLDVYFQPLSVHVKEKKKELSAMKTVQFECEARGSRPSAVISWRKGSFKLTEAVSNISAQGNITTSILTLTPSSDDNGKFLYCQADNPAIPGSVIEDGWKLDVHYVPLLSLRLGSKLRLTNIIEGMDVYFECNIRANPWVSETGWKFDGQVLKNNISAGIVINNQSLVLQKVTRVHRGKYSCTGTNSEGQGESSHIYLRVLYSPMCKTDERKSFSVMINEPIEIPCEVFADPDTVNFRWEFNSSTTGGNVQEFKALGSSKTSLLKYISKSEADFGNIYCWATNSIGKQSIPCAFNISQTDILSTLHTCIQAERTYNSISITCNTTSGMNAEDIFYVEIRDNEKFLVQNFTTKESEFEVKNLKHNSIYSVQVFLINNARKSKPLILEVLTSPGTKSNATNGSNWSFEYSSILYLSTAVAGAFALVLIVTACAIKFFLIRRKKLMNQQGNEKSAHNSEKSGDSCSEGFPYNGREDEKLRESIPDVVVFSEKLKSEDSGVRKYFSTSSCSYSNPVTLPSDQEMIPQAKMKNFETIPPWSTADWVIPTQPVEMVTLQFHNTQTISTAEGAITRCSEQHVPSQTLSTISETKAALTSSSTFSSQPPTTFAKQTDV